MMKNEMVSNAMESDAMMSATCDTETCRRRTVVEIAQSNSAILREATDIADNILHVITAEENIVTQVEVDCLIGEMEMQSDQLKSLLAKLFRIRSSLFEC